MLGEALEPGVKNTCKYVNIVHNTVNARWERSSRVGLDTGGWGEIGL